ncbi:hypothetical protein WEI85_11265 [Actinomycetes bacterium KLBMP 9797]
MACLEGCGYQGRHRHHADDHAGARHAEPLEAGEPADERDHGHPDREKRERPGLDGGRHPQPGRLERHRGDQQEGYGERAAVGGHPHRAQAGQDRGGEQGEEDLAAERAEGGEHADQIRAAGALHERGAGHHDGRRGDDARTRAATTQERRQQRDAEGRGADHGTDDGRVGVRQRDEDADVERGHAGGREHGEDAQLPAGEPARARGPAGDGEQDGRRDRVPEALAGEVGVVDDQLAQRDGAADDRHPEDAEQGTGFHAADAMAPLDLSTEPMARRLTGPNPVA